MSLTIKELTLETLVDEIVDIHNFNVNVLKVNVDEILENLNTGNGSLDVSGSTVGEIKGKSVVVTENGVSVLSGDLTLLDGDISMSNGDILGPNTTATISRINTSVNRNSGPELKSYTTVSVAGTISPILSNTILISADGVFTLDASLVEVVGSLTYSQEITIVYLPSNAVDSTINGVGLGGINTLTLTPGSIVKLRYIGSSWLVMSSNGVTIA